MDKNTPADLRKALEAGQDIYLSEAPLQLLRDQPRPLKIRVAKSKGQNLVYFGPQPINFLEMNREETIRFGRILIELGERSDLVLTAVDAPSVLN